MLIGLRFINEQHLDLICHCDYNFYGWSTGLVGDYTYPLTT